MDARPLMQLFDMSIEKNDGNSMVILAKLLFAGVPNVGRDVNRAIGLCQKYMFANESGKALISLTTEIVNERHGAISDMGFAIQLCEICPKKKEYEEPMLILAKIFISGDSNVEKLIVH